MSWVEIIVTPKSVHATLGPEKRLYNDRSDL